MHVWNLCEFLHCSCFSAQFRAEELHFVENGCHDNPTLDVTNDSQPEMQQKKPSTNGLAAGGEGVREDGSRWQVMGRLIRWKIMYMQMDEE